MEAVELPENLEEVAGNPFSSPYKSGKGILITNRSPHFKIENDLLIQGTTVIAYSGMPTKIVVPGYITSIGDEAFFCCDKLKKIYVSCSRDDDEAVVLDKFKRMLKKEFHDKLEIMRE